MLINQKFNYQLDKAGNPEEIIYCISDNDADEYELLHEEFIEDYEESGTFLDAEEVDAWEKYMVDAGMKFTYAKE